MRVKNVNPFVSVVLHCSLGVPISPFYFIYIFCITKKTRVNSIGKDVETMKRLSTVCGDVTWYNHWKILGNFLKNLKI